MVTPASCYGKKPMLIVLVCGISLVFFGSEEIRSLEASLQMGYSGNNKWDPVQSEVVFSSSSLRPQTQTQHQSSLPVTDPMHTPRLTHFWDTSNFPKPEFHGCSDGLCRYSNICYSSRDHVLVPDVPGLRSNTSSEPEWYDPESPFNMGVYPTRKPRLVSPEAYSTWTNVWFADTAFAMNCVRQHDGGHSQSHTMMGMGKLFAYSSGRWDDNNDNNHHNATASDAVSTPTSVDVLLYHQCSPPGGWSWGEYVTDLMWKDALAQGRIEGPLHEALVFLPWNQRNDFVDPGEPVVCVKEAYQAPYYPATYLDGNDFAVVQRWKTMIQHRMGTDEGLLEAIATQKRAYQEAKHEQLLQQQQEHNHTDTDTDTDTNTNTTIPDPEDIEYPQQYNYLFNEDPEYCRRNLKIAVFQREKAESAGRRFINLPEVEDVIREVTDEPIRKITTSSKLSVEDQAALFYEAFDILVTPHGSQLVNMLFGGVKFFAYVEVASVFLDAAPAVNGRAFAWEWVESFGHLPHGRPDLLELMPVCADRNDLVNCPLYPTREEFKGSDLLVNTTILRTDLGRAVSALCPDVLPGAEPNETTTPKENGKEEA